MSIVARAALLAGALSLLPRSPARAESSPLSLDSCLGFASHAEIGAELDGLAESYPDLAATLTVGLSVEGREIFGLVVSEEPGVEAAEPEVRVIGAIHGDECIAADLVLRLARWLVESHGSDPFVTELLGSAEVVLVPLVNPDGREGRRASRTNAHGVDLNRNLGFAWVAGDRTGPAPFSEPETRALRDLGLARSFVLGLSYHTRAEYVNGPWNYTPHHPPDEALVQAIGDAYAGSSGYRAVFGWDWFAIFGDVNDWSLGTRGTLDWTLELRSDHEMEWAVHEAGLRAFLAFAARGATGLVTDAATGEPLRARVDLAGGAPAFTDPEVGDYHRVLLAGTHELVAVAPGYLPGRATLSVGSGEAARASFALERAPAGEPDHAFAIVGMTLPEEIGEAYRMAPYLNATTPFAALGPEDGRGYSMSPGGTLTVEMGRRARDAAGPDLVVVSSSGSDDPLVVAVAESLDGPFLEVASGSGDLEADLAAVGLGSARFVRLADQGFGPFNDADAGYDLDAVVSLAPEPLPPLPEPDGDGDADADADGGGDADADADGGGDADADADGGTDGDGGPVGIERERAACGCSAVRPRARLGTWPLGIRGGAAAHPGAPSARTGRW